MHGGGSRRTLSLAVARQQETAPRTCAGALDQPARLLDRQRGPVAQSYLIPVVKSRARGRAEVCRPDQSSSLPQLSVIDPLLTFALAARTRPRRFPCGRSRGDCAWEPGWLARRGIAAELSRRECRSLADCAESLIGALKTPCLRISYFRSSIPRQFRVIFAG